MKETITILYPTVSHVTKGFSLLILLGLFQNALERASIAHIASLPFLKASILALSQGSNPTPENRNGYTIFMLFVDCKKKQQIKHMAIIHR